MNRPMMKPEIQALLNDPLLRDEEKILIMTLRYKFMHGKVLILMRDGRIQRTLLAYQSQEIAGEDLMDMAEQIVNSI